MATYSTDLTTLTTAESGTWTEFAAPYDGAGTPAADGENYIQGTDCRSQTTGKANGLEISCVYDHTTNVTISTDEVVLAWVFYAVGTNLETYANSGWRYGIGSSTSAWEWWRIGGSDYGRNPYGGWVNVAIDPTATSTSIGGGNSGNYRYFGSVPYTINEITKGTPSAQDAIRYGRGEISVIGTGGTFSELAQYNDYNAGGTPPGTSSTSVDSGRHRLGLFQDAGGTYLWKGLMSLGTSASPGAVTWDDGNCVILIDDAPNTYAEFNKIEINNTASSVTWSGVSMQALGTVAPGVFEVVDNATVVKAGCTFTDMGAFTYKDGTNPNTITSTTYRRCGLVTTGGATCTNCTFDEPSGAIGVTASSPANAEKISNCTFNSDGTGNGLEITGTAADFELTNLTFTGYDTANPGTAANKAIYVNISSGTITLTITGGSGVTAAHHVRTAGATVTVVTGAVTTQVKAQTAEGAAIQDVYVHVRATSSSPEGPIPVNASVTITRTGSPVTATVSHTAHGYSANQKVLIQGANEWQYNGVKTITSATTNSYDYLLPSDPGGNATGTITSTGVILDGLTSAAGLISDSRTFATDQAVTGWARKSTSTPFYQQATLNGTIDTSGGLSLIATMISDE